MPPIFKDPQQKKRKFGTDITNTYRKRPRFSAEQEPSDSSCKPCSLPPANYVSNATRTAKPRFTERRLTWDNELQEEDMENSVKLPRGTPTLAVGSHEILINPRRIPLDKANFVRYTDRVVMAVPQPKP